MDETGYFHAESTWNNCWFLAPTWSTCWCSSPTACGENVSSNTSALVLHAWGTQRSWPTLRASLRLHTVSAWPGTEVTWASKSMSASLWSSMCTFLSCCTHMASPWPLNALSRHFWKQIHSSDVPASKCSTAVSCTADFSLDGLTQYFKVWTWCLPNWDFLISPVRLVV